MWRGDSVEGIPTLINFCERLKDIIKKYDNVAMVEGWKLVTYLSEYFIDNLHPNQLGTNVYAENLVRKIERLKF